MRNYVALNLVTVGYNQTGQDDPPTATVEVFGTSLDDVAANIQKMHISLGGFFVELVNGGIWYILIDKANVAQALNTKACGRFISDPFFGVTGVGEQADPPRDNSATFDAPNSPRSGWTDGEGVERKHVETPKAGAQSVDGLLQLLIAHMYQRKPPRPDIALKLGQILTEHLRCEGALKGQKPVNKDKQLACDITALDELGALQKQFPGVFNT